MSYRLIRSVTAEIEITPEEAAQVFWGFTDAEQATFFHSLGQISEGRLHMQMLMASAYLSRQGRDVMQTIGDYALEALDREQGDGK